MTARLPAPIRLIAGDAEQLCNEVHGGAYRAYSARPEKLAKVMPPNRTLIFSKYGAAVNGAKEQQPQDLRMMLSARVETRSPSRHFGCLMYECLGGMHGTSILDCRHSQQCGKWLRNWNCIGLCIEDTI